MSIVPLSRLNCLDFLLLSTNLNPKMYKNQNITFLLFSKLGIMKYVECDFFCYDQNIFFIGIFEEKNLYLFREFD